jgi:hypothetical protein
MRALTEETADLVTSAIDEEHGRESRFLVAVEPDGGVVRMTTVKRLKHRLYRAGPQNSPPQTSALANARGG